MKRHQGFNRQFSVGLRNRLIQHLTALFADGRICKYIPGDGNNPELQIIRCYPAVGALPVLPQIKLAYRVWLGMHAADRHAVLGRFQQHYAGLSITAAGNRKTLVFCALFVHEFVPLLDEAMQWPE